MLKANESLPDYVGNLEDSKKLLQPLVSLLAVAQKCTFSNICVPVIAIFGNRYKYRPLLYFKEYDVALTTPRTISLRTDDTVDTYGLMFLHILFNLHDNPFKSSELNKLPKTGWTDIMPPGAYSTFPLKVGSTDPSIAHSEVPPYFHSLDDVLS